MKMGEVTLTKLNNLGIFLIIVKALRVSPKYKNSFLDKSQKEYS